MSCCYDFPDGGVSVWQELPSFCFCKNRLNDSNSFTSSGSKIQNIHIYYKSFNMFKEKGKQLTFKRYKFSCNLNPTMTKLKGHMTQF